MKHWYVTGPEQIELVEVEVPAPGTGEVLVRTAFSALSPGSNVHVFKSGTYQMDGQSPRTEALSMANGVIEAIGPNVTDRSVGDRDAMSGSGHQEFAVLPVNRTFLVPAALSLQDAGGLIAAGRLGRLISSEAIFTTSSVAVRDPKNAIFSRDLMGGGVLHWLGVHDLDVLLWLSGEPIVELQAMAGTVAGEGIDVEDVISISVRYRSGAIGTIH